MASHERQITGSENSASISVWDSEYCSSSEAFSFFRDVISSTFMPWQPEFESDQPFKGRIKGLVSSDRSLAHVNISPLVAARTKANVAESQVEGFFANFILTGDLRVEQAGRSVLAKPGDLVVYDTSSPVTMTSRGDSIYEDISFLIPKSCFSRVSNLENQLRNVLVKKQRMINPLYSGLRFLADNIGTLSEDEIMSLYESCVSLIPLSVKDRDDPSKRNLDDKHGEFLRQEIKVYLNRNLSEAELSPVFAAQHFSISVRYVHKLFAGSGTTFNAYLLARRLDNVRDDLLSPLNRPQPISALAYRWGFRDLSSFNRAFKKRFGCTPRQLRARAI
jgi:AraC family transcriptional activator of tynA and feaB